MRRWELSLSEASLALAHVDPYERDTWLRMGMALKAEFGDDAFEMWDAWSAEAANYNAGDVRTAWRSFSRAGKVTIGTLIHEAKQGGWTPPAQERPEAERRELEAKRAQRQRDHQELARAEAERIEAWQQRIAELAQRCWEEYLAASGQAPYLGRKRVRAFGLGFVRRGTLVIIDEQAESTRIITGREAVAAWFESGERESGHISFRYLKAGTIAVPMRDADSRLWGLQFIFSGGGKKFLRHGRKRGTFHLIGELAPHRPLAFAEGYATAASIHEATGWPVAVVFDAGNLPPVANELRERYPDTPFVFCGDDDHETEGNPGRHWACRAAGETEGQVAFPRFRDPKDRTDWNDLHLEQGLDAVRRQLVDGDTIVVEPPAPASADGAGDQSRSKWRARLVCNQNGGVRATLHNIITVLENDERWRGLFAMNAFANKILRTREAPYGTKTGEIHEVDGAEIAAWFGDPVNYALSVSSKMACEAVEVVANRRQFHPVLEYLDSLQWDGIDRLPNLLADYFGAEQDDYTATVGRNWLVSAVARVRDPGSKVDFMVILEGRQGTGKSTAVRTLCGPEWFAEMMESPQNIKDFQQILTGRWMVEIPELQAFNKADRNKIKATLSAQEDTYRPSYGRYARQFPRQSIFIGTTNDDVYLKDETGGRRFMPVRCGEINLEALAALRDQLWAEAEVRWRRGEQYWKFPKQAADEQETRYDADVWEEPIDRWLTGYGKVDDYPEHYPVITPDRPVRETTIHDVMLHALKIEVGKQNRPDQMRVSNVLKRFGYSKPEKARKRLPDGKRANVFVREGKDSI